MVGVIFMMSGLMMCLLWMLMVIVLSSWLGSRSVIFCVPVGSSSSVLVFPCVFSLMIISAPVGSVFRKIFPSSPGSWRVRRVVCSRMNLVKNVSFVFIVFSYLFLIIRVS